LKIVGKELGVQAVLTGRMVQHGDDLTLFLSLVDATTENQLWGKQYDQKLTDLVRLQTQIAEDVSENLKAKLTTADQQKLSRRYTASPEAYRLYLQGRYLWNKRTERDMSKSLEYFQQAVALDPNYALAYTGIADAYVNLSMGFNFGPMQPSLGLPKAKEAALKALQTGWRGGISWQDVEVAARESGAPYLIFRGQVLEVYKKFSATATHLSLSHTSEHAIAQVILERSL